MSKRRLGAKTLVHPLTAVLVGTHDEDGTPNAMTAAWCATCCMSPPCVGVAVRKERLTYANIEHRRSFSICVPSTAMSLETARVSLPT